MQFETKTVELIGVIKPIDANTSSQAIRLTIGVVGCPHDDIITIKVIKYTFANTLTVQEIKDGVTPFVDNWMNLNYPTIS